MSKLVIAQNMKQVEDLMRHCNKTKYASTDFETTGFKYEDPNEHALILGVSFQPGSSWVLPLGHKDSPLKRNYEKILYKFGKEVIENPDIIKVGWNWKFEYKWYMRYDIVPKGRQFDAMLAKYCLDEERPHGLKEFVADFFPQFAGYEQELKMIEETGEIKRVDWKNTDFQKLCKYCGLDSDLTLRGMIIMEPKLIKHKFYNLFRNLLMGILRVLSESEFRGMAADRGYLEKLMKDYEIKIRESDKGMRETPAVVKFERRHKRSHINKLMEKVKLEIREIAKSDAPNAARLIANRENKIKGFFEGKFNNKEKYDGLNFNSPDQMRDLFFLSPYGLKFKAVKYTKDKKTGKRNMDKPSTDEDSLEKLKKKDKTGFITKLLDHRALVKLDSTYITGMYHVLDHHDRIHANFRVNGTVTGRLSCVKPNLQNIPRGSTAADIKRQFIPPPGYLLLEVDYSQAELRIVAEVSGDKAMIEIFKKNYNIHVATAAKMNGGIHLYDKAKEMKKKGDAMDAADLAKPENKEILKWVKEVKKGKSLNFSIVYQQGDDATAETLECSKEDAAKFKADWFRQFPQVKKWIKRQKRDAHRDEYVYSLFGRKRRLSDINCGDDYWEAEAERQAVNAPIQGASGDFTLFSQVVIREHILKGKLPRDLIHVYTVHDSIGYYVRPKDIHTVVPIITKICDNPETMKYFGFQLKDVTMKVSAEVGMHWAALKDYDPWVDYNELSKQRDTIL
jgi:DNA polymerase I-like protein with 3'-5' exonuclease and polymerase domains